MEQIFGQILSIRIKTLSNTNMVTSRLIQREKGSLPVHVRRSKTSLRELPISLSSGNAIDFPNTIFIRLSALGDYYIFRP